MVIDVKLRKDAEGGLGDLCIIIIQWTLTV